jgi:hypothetical protein
LTRQVAPGINFRRQTSAFNPRATKITTKGRSQRKKWRASASALCYSEDE